MPMLGDTGYQLDPGWDEAGMGTEMGACDHREGNEHTEALGRLAPSWGRFWGVRGGMALMEEVATGADFESLRTQPFLFLSPSALCLWFLVWTLGFCSSGYACRLLPAASAPASGTLGPKKFFSKLNWSRCFIAAAGR